MFSKIIKTHNTVICVMIPAFYKRYFHLTLV